MIADLGLAGRIDLAGPRTAAGLDELWQDTDLLVLPSLCETFGMVVTEALARGIPALVRADTGAQEALSLAGSPLPGACFAADDLADTLCRWLTDAAVRQAWAGAARSAGPLLPTWAATARAVAAAMLPGDKR